MEVTKASNRGTELGYAEITSNFDGTAASLTLADVTGLSTTVTVGSRPILLTFNATAAYNSGTGAWKVAYVQDSDTAIILSLCQALTANQKIPVQASVRLAPSAGSHTYKIQFACTAANGTPTIAATSVAPAFIQITEI